MAAIAILREIPDATYLEWLAHRPAGEAPFVGYPVGMALLQVARVRVIMEDIDISGVPC